MVTSELRSGTQQQVPPSHLPSVSRSGSPLFKFSAHLLLGKEVSLQPDVHLFLQLNCLPLLHPAHSKRHQNEITKRHSGARSFARSFTGTIS